MEANTVIELFEELKKLIAVLGQKIATCKNPLLRHPTCFYLKYLVE